MENELNELLDELNALYAIGDLNADQAERVDCIIGQLFWIDPTLTITLR